jgi:hypothetical protein
MAFVEIDSYLFEETASTHLGSQKIFVVVSIGGSLVRLLVEGSFQRRVDYSDHGTQNLQTG